MTKRTFTMKVDGKSYLNTVDYSACIHLAQTHLIYQKSVTVTDNHLRKVVARFIYGHKQ